MATEVGEFKHLKESIANSANFQAWTSTGDAAAAKAFIHIQEIPAVRPIVRPYALIFKEPDDISIKRAVSIDTFRDGGRIHILFEGLSLAAETTLEGKYVEFLNRIDAIINEIWAQRNTAGRLNLQESERDGGPGPVAQNRKAGNANDDVWQEFWNVTWGIAS